MLKSIYNYTNYYLLNALVHIATKYTNSLKVRLNMA